MLPDEVGDINDLTKPIGFQVTRFDMLNSEFCKPPSFIPSPQLSALSRALAMKEENTFPFQEDDSIFDIPKFIFF